MIQRQKSSFRAGNKDMKLIGFSSNILSDILLTNMKLCLGNITDCHRFSQKLDGLLCYCLGKLFGKFYISKFISLVLFFIAFCLSHQYFCDTFFFFYTLFMVVAFCPFTMQMRIKNPVKHLKWRFLRKQLTAESR